MRREYHFTVSLIGYGETPTEAWADAVDALTSDPRPVPDYTIEPPPPPRTQNHALECTKHRHITINGRCLDCGSVQ